MNSEFKMNIPNQPLAGHSATISIHIIIELNVLCCQTISNVASVLFHFRSLLFDAINTTFYTSYSAFSSAHNLLRLRHIIWIHSRAFHTIVWFCGDLISLRERVHFIENFTIYSFISSSNHINPVQTRTKCSNINSIWNAIHLAVFCRL